MSTRIQYIKIPIQIFVSKELTAGEKLFCGMLLNLMAVHGYCFASDKYLAEQGDLNPRTVQRRLTKLASLDFIRVCQDAGMRKIFPGAQALHGTPDTPADNPGEADQMIPDRDQMIQNADQKIPNLDQMIPNRDQMIPPFIIDKRKVKEDLKEKRIKTFAPPDGSAQATLFDLEEEPAPQVASQPPKPKKQPKPKATPSAEIPAAFAAFWEAYPRNLGYFRPAALAAWNKANPTPEQAAQIMAGLDDWKRYWEDRQTHWEYMPLPAKFLKEERWKYGSEVRSKAHTTLDRNARFYYHGPSTTNDLPGIPAEMLARPEIPDEELDRGLALLD